MLVRRLTFSAVLLLPWLPGTALAQDIQVDSEEIIVTGEKAGRTVKETTTSVAITTAERIRQENTQTIQDIYNRTANVSETYGSSGFTIRGINNKGVAAGGGADTATVYLDGAPLPNQALFGGPTDLWDVEQVEILRGPQSTIQGLNTLAGAVIITTREPSTDRWSADGRVLWTDQVDRTFSVAVGGPLIEDELGIRLSAERRADRGIIRNITRGGRDDSMRSLSLRGKLKWTPQALSGLTATLTYNRVRRDGGYLFEYVRTDLPDYYDHRRSTSDAEIRGLVRTDLAALDLDYEFGSGLTLTSVSSWSKVSGRSLTDGDNSPADEELIDNRYHFRTLTQEVRLNYRGERLSGLLGAWYYRRTGAVDADSRINIDTPTPTIVNLLRANGFPAASATSIANSYAVALPVIPVSYSADQPLRIETMALFGDARWRLTDRLSLIGGFRYDHERNRFAAETVATFIGTLPDPAAFAPAGNPVNTAVRAINQGVLGLVAQAGSPFASNARTFHAFLPKAGISMEWTPDLVTAFTVQRAYRSGGSSQNPARALLVPYDPEHSWNYEGSLRSTWLDGKLRLNANAFYVEWRDQQVNVFRGLNAYDYNTVNAGHSHLYGFEVEAEARPSAAFDAYASIGYVRTKFDDFELPAGTTSTVQLAGSEFAYAPRWTLAGGVNYRLGGGFTANANVNYRGAVYGDVGSNQATSRLPARTMANVRLGYDAGRWSLFGFVRNLFDEKYKQYARTDLPVAILGEPRTVGGGVELHW
ncbi:TonB-dependent receptor [Sphingomonas cannabina]|uniref:TonB-dependent receptor n=1 Tax=Sphingomonas cannabina TaxID=2899123 RepID=UPI001F1E5110|nr:TonB-dependent receptor [Sphingomonas cannabina]UIJ44837.1 TonB-dependent receptor [Sphingomonas cannabina]